MQIDAPLRTAEDVDSGSPIPRWLPLAVLGAIPFLALRVRFDAISDPDTFWHILAGQHVWHTWSFAGADPLGTFTSHRWVLHEWLPQLALYGLDTACGLPAIACAAFAGYLAVFVLLVRSCRQYAGLLPTTLAALIAWVGASASLTPRPQIITFALLSLSMVAWRQASKKMRAPWWLVPLSWVWASSHGMWFIGPLVGVAWTVGLVLDRRLSRRDAAKFSLVPALCVVAAALTPVGPGLLLAPPSVADYTSFVTEWAPPSIRDLYVQATFLMLIAIAVAWARNQRPSWVEILLWVLAVGWTLLYARTVAIGAILAAPLFAQALQGLLQRATEPRTRLESIVLAGSCAIALAVAAFMAPRVAENPAEVPLSLHNELAGLRPGTIVLNEYRLGGWLMWEHPTLKPVIDPRTELYGVDYLRKYGAAWAVEPGWQDFVTRTSASVALVPRLSPLGQALKDVRGWKEVGRGDGYLLLKAP